jgi:hypothetical protein
MELNGALSNPLQSHKDLHLERLEAVKSEALGRERSPNRPSRRISRRQGSVLTAVTTLLATAAEPMRVRDIHAAVEQLLDDPISYSAVKEALSAHARGPDQRFQRRRRGYYQLLPRPQTIRTH